MDPLSANKVIFLQDKMLVQMFCIILFEVIYYINVALTLCFWKGSERFASGVLGKENNKLFWKQ